MDQGAFDDDNYSTTPKCRIRRSIDVEGGSVWSYIEKILRRQERVGRRAD
jgi:hypothetical protein